MATSPAAAGPPFRWRAAASFGLLVVVLGVLTSAWWAGPGAVLDWLFIGSEPVGTVTAAAFCLSGLALIVVSQSRGRGLARLLSGLARLLSGLVLVVCLPALTLPWRGLAGPAVPGGPGPMLFSDSLGFLLFLIGLGIAIAEPRERGWVRVLVTIGPVMAALATLALLGGAAEIASPLPHRLWYWSPQPVALLFLFLSCGLIALGWHRARSGGVPPLWLPMVISGTLASASFVAWLALNRLEVHQIQNTVAAEGELVRAQLASRFETRAAILSRIARRWHLRGHPDPAILDFDAQLYFGQYTDLALLGQVAPAGHWPWRAVAPGQTPPETLAAWSQTLPGRVAPQGVTIGDGAPLPGGGEGAWLAIQVGAPDHADGLLVAVVNPQRLVADSLTTLRLTHRYRLAINGPRGAVYESGPDPREIPASYHQRVPLRIGPLDWSLQIWPERETLDRLSGPLSTLLLTGGLGLSWLLGLIVRLSQRAAVRAEEAEAASAALAREAAVRQQAEAALARQTADLRRSNADLEQFAYVASHDLQEPLRMVTSYLQLIERRYRDQLDDDGREFIGFAVDGASRMRTLIDDLLTYSRLGSHPAPFQPCDLNAVFDQAVARLRLAINDSSATVTKSQLPEVVGDPVQLTQLMQNLIANAIKFRGEAPPRVEVEAARQGAMWRCVVRDNGIGIAPEDVGRVFLIFQRLHSRAEYDGTGIGLAVCQRIVERHGGEIGLQPAPGGGTECWWTLPADGGQAP